MTHVVPGRRPVAEALRAGRPVREVVLAGTDGALAVLAAAAEQGGVAVRRAGRTELDALAGGVAHQGVVAVCPPPTPGSLDQAATGDLVMVLDHVTDPQNLGSVARCAEAAGCAALIVPSRRSAAVTPAAEKAAAGALSWLPVVTVPNLVTALRLLGEAGLWSVGLAGDARDTVWSTPLLDERVALVAGAEGSGLSHLTRKRVDTLVAIPLRGRVGSLNVAAAAAIALAEILRRRTVQRDVR